MRLKPNALKIYAGKSRNLPGGCVVEKLKAQSSRLKAQSTKASLRFNNIRRPRPPCEQGEAGGLRRLTQIKFIKEIRLKAESKME